MSKDQLIKFIEENIQFCHHSDEEELLYVLEEFFSQNVVIPKGENRHPYADVLHEWIEDTAKVLEYSSHGSDFPVWQTSVLMRGDHYVPLRIKPKEPVYEWQWCVIMDNGTGSIYGFHTEDGINNIFKNRKKFKIESTKRERK